MSVVKILMLIHDASDSDDYDVNEYDYDDDDVGDDGYDDDRGCSLS